MLVIWCFSLSLYNLFTMNIQKMECNICNYIIQLEKESIIEKLNIFSLFNV